MPWHAHCKAFSNSSMANSLTVIKQKVSQFMLQTFCTKGPKLSTKHCENGIKYRQEYQKNLSIACNFIISLTFSITCPCNCELYYVLVTAFNGAYLYVIFHLHCCTLQCLPVTWIGCSKLGVIVSVVHFIRIFSKWQDKFWVNLHKLLAKNRSRNSESLVKWRLTTFKHFRFRLIENRKQ